MKKSLILFASVLALSLAAAESLDWKTRDGNLTNWSGKVEPLEGGGMQLKGQNCISYSQAKFPVRDQRNVRISFTVHGCASRIGIYCYSNNRFIGSFMERIPNAGGPKKFEAGFAIPQQIKGKTIDSVRIVFASSSGLKIYQVEMFLEN